MNRSHQEWARRVSDMIVVGLPVESMVRGVRQIDDSISQALRGPVTRIYEVDNEYACSAWGCSCSDRDRRRYEES